MKDILLKRNDLKNKSVKLNSIKFDDELKNKDVARLLNEQHRVYNKWNFYDKFIKAREEVKNEIKLDDMGKAE